MADVAPIEKGSKEATFTALAEDFKFDERVRTLFLNGSMEHLEDFRYHLRRGGRLMRSWRQMRH